SLKMPIICSSLNLLRFFDGPESIANRIISRGATAKPKRTEHQIVHGQPLFVGTDVVKQQIGNIDMNAISTGAKFDVRHFIGQIKNRSNLTKTVEKAAKIRPNGGGAPKVIEDIKASNGNKVTVKNVALSKISYKKSHDFSGKDLQGADFRGQDLRGAIFDNCDLTDAMFDGALLEGASFKNVIAIGSSFIESKMNDADLSSGDFRNSDFTKAKMQRTTLSEASFREAVLGNADARNANFDGTQLGDGYMRGFNMEGAKIGNVHVFGDFKNAFDGAIMNPDDEAYLKKLLGEDYVPGAQPKRKRGDYDFEPKAKRDSDDKMSFGTRRSEDSDSLVQTGNSAVTSDYSYSEAEEPFRSTEESKIYEVDGANDENTSPMM
ncbi:MAG: pentapeptide repeat-containing protein, partial [Lentilitoribacter sp.]